MLKPLSHFIFLLCICPLAVVAQINIKGKILDADTKKEVPFASVFLNNTSIGARTTEDGIFELKEVKNGKYTLIVSCIGYAAAKEEIFVKGEDINLGTIKIRPVATNLSEVKIKPRKILSASKRETYLRWFLQHFLGKTENAKSCKLINPQILEFDYDENNGKLTVTAPDFLIIENRALGYRIKFLLQDFLFDDRNYLIHYTGFSTFENLPGKEEQLIAWKKRRMDAYLGSEMHFYRSCMANLVKANGFEVFRLDRTPTLGRATDSLIKVKLLYYNARNGIGDSLSYWRKQAMIPAFDQRVVKPALKPTDYLKTTNERGIFALTYPQRLYVSYKNPEKGAVTYGSILTLIKPEVFFDSNGIVIDPLSIQVDAYWAKLRMADTLPYNYEPNIVIEEI